MAQAPAVGEPTRWGWVVALMAMAYFLRPEGLLPRGVWMHRLLGNPAACRGYKTDGVSKGEKR
ncbi:MAG: hypothetical protein O6948_05220 [Deltaproteobacteria bacterium]|nr:hypothetical protein [Deltaproteobacteria bacterium]